MHVRIAIAHTRTVHSSSSSSSSLRCVSNASEIRRESETNERREKRMSETVRLVAAARAGAGSSNWRESRQRLGSASLGGRLIIWHFPWKRCVFHHLCCCRCCPVQVQRIDDYSFSLSLSFTPTDDHTHRRWGREKKEEEETNGHWRRRPPPPLCTVL